MARTAARIDATPPFMSHAPRPYSRSPSIAADHGSSDQVPRSPTGTTSTCPTSTIRRPPGRPMRPRTIGSRSRGISSPGQSGSSRTSAGSGSTSSTRQPTSASSVCHAVLDGALVARDARDPDDRRSGRRSPSPPRPRRPRGTPRRAGAATRRFRLPSPEDRSAPQSRAAPVICAGGAARREQVNTRLRGLADSVMRRPMVKTVVPVLVLVLVATVLATNPPAQPASTSAPGSPIAGASPHDLPRTAAQPRRSHPSHGRTSSSGRSRWSRSSPRIGRTARASPRPPDSPFAAWARRPQPSSRRAWRPGRRSSSGSVLGPRSTR